MIIEMVTVGMFDTNCYLLGCSETGDGVVIDPGAEGKAILQTIKRMGLKIRYIINTHGHVDHIGANGFLREELKVPLLLHENDLPLYKNPGFGLKVLFRSQPPPDRFLGDSDILAFGNQQLQVLETPGHTPGGITLLSGKAVFCGDTIFAGSVGRTDLTGGSFSVLIASIRKRLLTLPDDTSLYPGHGPVSSIGTEAASNPFITGASG